MNQGEDVFTCRTAHAIQPYRSVWWHDLAMNDTHIVEIQDYAYTATIFHFATLQSGYGKNKTLPHFTLRS